MFWLLYKTLKEVDELAWYKTAAAILYFWIAALKFVKVSAQFKKYPKDIVYLPAYLSFGYWGTVVKIWACLACWNATWATAKKSNEASEVKECEEAKAASTALESREGLLSSS